MKKKMFLIVKVDGKKLWTEKYTEQDGFLMFNVLGVGGSVVPYQVSKKSIQEISQHEVDDVKKEKV